jgi:hypothetical protein
VDGETPQLDPGRSSDAFPVSSDQRLDRAFPAASVPYEVGGSRRNSSERADAPSRTEIGVDSVDERLGLESDGH